MANNLKDMMPQKGRINQGFFRPKNPDKYIGDLSKIIYRSAWELKFLMFCDREERVLKYSIEMVTVPYYNPITKRVNNYTIDFYMELLNEKGEVDKWLIEVKPKKFCFKPEPPKRKTERSLHTYKKNLETSFINRAKFTAARGFARDNDMQFGIVTEGFTFKNMIH